jgi:two-component system, OmpR family, phosphate regulon sensor histidine kinase PhoR
MNLSPPSPPRRRVFSKPPLPTVASSLPTVDQGALCRAALEDSPLATLILDKSLRVIYGNQSVRRLALPHRLQVGQQLAELTFGDEVVTLAEAALVDEEDRQTELARPGRGEAGQEQRLSLHISTLRTNGFAGLILRLQDITHYSLLEQIRKDFVTNASHELRTPLSLIHGYIETLRTGVVKSHSSQQRCLEVMDKHSRRMMRLIEDMLTISKLESGEAQLNEEHFHVRACVEDVLEHLTPIIEMKKPRIELHFPPNGMLYGDRFYWDQIYSNLIENALKQNPQEGLLLTLSGEWTNDSCVLKVADNGVGIPPEDQPFVFKRFFRCAKHHSQEIKGTGLGLSIVKRAVDAHGGSISLTSTPGVQTCFTICLPLRKDPLPQ